MTSASEPFARRFIDALHGLERDGQAGLDAMVALFSDSARISNAAMKQAGNVREGRDGAARFWSDYAATFEGASTEFHRVTLGGDAIGLFWTTRGAKAVGDGARLDYDGATLLELDGSGSGDSGLIVRFTGYYDTRALSA